MKIIIFQVYASAPSTLRVPSVKELSTIIKQNVHLSGSVVPTRIFPLCDPISLGERFFFDQNIFSLASSQSISREGNVRNVRIRPDCCRSLHRLLLFFFFFSFSFRRVQNEGLPLSK